VKEEIQYQSMGDFLESTAPNQLVEISDAAQIVYRPQLGQLDVIKTPEIQLHCSHENCSGIRFVRCVSGAGQHLTAAEYMFLYLTYRCSNYQKVEKTFSLAAKIDIEREPHGKCYKFGKLPAYGPPVSPKLVKLIGPDRDEFLKGRRCENQGLGVGAFIYYRRVVEKQKNRIIGETIKLTRKIAASEEKLEKLQNAIEETQFSKALDPR
jgi:hypothetical protein